jgi:hypothetical protein
VLGDMVVVTLNTMVVGWQVTMVRSGSAVGGGRPDK